MASVSLMLGEFVSQSFALACPFHQSRNIDDFDRRGDDTLRVHQLGELVQPFIGNGDDAHIRFDGAERKVCRLGFGVG